MLARWTLSEFATGSHFGALLAPLVLQGHADVERMLRSLREPQGRGALEADGPEAGLALLVRRQLHELGLAGQPVAEKLPLDLVIVIVPGAVLVPVAVLLFRPAVPHDLLCQALVHRYHHRQRAETIAGTADSDTTGQPNQNNDSAKCACRYRKLC